VTHYSGKILASKTIEKKDQGYDNQGPTQCPAGNFQDDECGNCPHDNVYGKRISYSETHFGVLVDDKNPGYQYQNDEKPIYDSQFFVFFTDWIK
jgi:hypothetical protein